MMRVYMIVDTMRTQRARITQDRPETKHTQSNCIHTFTPPQHNQGTEMHTNPVVVCYRIFK